MFNSDGELSRMLVERLLAQSVKLPDALRNTVAGDFGFEVTPEFVQRFVLALLSLAISIPNRTLRKANIFLATASLLKNHPEQTTVDALITRLLKGFSSASPTYAAGITQDMLIEVATVLTMDWLLQGNIPKAPVAQADMNLYTTTVFEIHGHKPDLRQIARETLANTRAQDFPPNMRPEVEALLGDFERYLKQGDDSTPTS